jgi:hypothetical protein
MIVPVQPLPTKNELGSLLERTHRYGAARSHSMLFKIRKEHNKEGDIY